MGYCGGDRPIVTSDVAQALSRLDGLEAFVHTLGDMADAALEGHPDALVFGEIMKGAGERLDGEKLAGFHLAIGFWIGMILRDNKRWSPEAMAEMLTLFDILASRRLGGN